MRDVDRSRRRVFVGAGVAALEWLVPGLDSARASSNEVAPESDLAKMRAYTIPPSPGQDDRSCDPREYFRQLSNWGRWGAEDVLGTLNLITPQVRAAAAALVHEGISVSCGWEIDQQPTHDSLQRFMHVLPNEAVEKQEGNRHLGSAGEYISMRTHGIWVTHVDALSHVFWDGKMYNGFPASSVSARAGASKGAIAMLHAGIVSRGVMLDIPALLGVSALDEGYAVTPEELESAEVRQRVRVRSGDVVLLRTGQGRRVREAGGYLPQSHPMPGWHPRCLPWLHQRGVAGVGTDAAHDPFPSRFAWSEHYLPFHDVGIVAMGLCLIDWCNLEELADKCTQLGRHEFQIVIAPLRLCGCTASPVNPIAIF